MFDFEDFPVYKKTELLIKKFQVIFNNKFIHKSVNDQLYRAVHSILLNIAEGAGKFNSKDKKNFYVIARGSTNECAPILKILLIEGFINKQFYDEVYADLNEISKMLSGLIRYFKDKK